MCNSRNPLRTVNRETDYIFRGPPAPQDIPWRVLGRPPTLPLWVTTPPRGWPSTIIAEPVLLLLLADNIKCVFMGSTLQSAAMRLGGSSSQVKRKVAGRRSKACKIKVKVDRNVDFAVPQRRSRMSGGEM